MRTVNVTMVLDADSDQEAIEAVRSLLTPLTRDHDDEPYPAPQERFVDYRLTVVESHPRFDEDYGLGEDYVRGDFFGESNTGTVTHGVSSLDGRIVARPTSR